MNRNDLVVKQSQAISFEEGTVQVVSVSGPQTCLTPFCLLVRGSFCRFIALYGCILYIYIDINLQISFIWNEMVLEWKVGSGKQCECRVIRADMA